MPLKEIKVEITTGRRGVAGDDGLDGSQIITGFAPPTTDDGNNSDLFFDFSLYDVYQKVDDVWQFKANIKGAPGQDGVSGLPTGGTIGQVLAKASGSDFDATWVDNNSIPSGTVEGAIQLRNSDGSAFTANDGFIYESASNTLRGVRTLSDPNGAIGVDNIIFGLNQDFSGVTTANRVNWSLIFSEDFTLTGDQSFNNNLSGGFQQSVTNASGGVFNSILWGFDLTVSGTAQRVGMAGFGSDNEIGNREAFVAGIRGRATGARSFVMANGVENNDITTVIASGTGAINMSTGTSNQTIGHGALAPSSAIFGGRDANIPADATNTVVLGSDRIKALSGVTNAVYMGSPYIFRGDGVTPTNDDALALLLAYDSTDGSIKTLTKSSIIGSTDFWPLGGTQSLTGNVTIDSLGVRYVRIGSTLAGEGQLEIGSSANLTFDVGGVVEWFYNGTGKQFSLLNDNELILAATASSYSLRLGNTTADMSGQDGAMYYNSTTDKARLYSNGFKDVMMDSYLKDYTGTGTENVFTLQPTINKASGDWHGLRINATQTAAPGDNTFLYFRADSTDMFRVYADGSIRMRDVTAPTDDTTTQHWLYVDSADNALKFRDEAGTVTNLLSSGTSVSFGAENQIPTVNATTDDFDYSAGLSFTGTTLTVGDGINTSQINIDAGANLSSTNSVLSFRQNGGEIASILYNDDNNRLTLTNSNNPIRFVPNNRTFELTTSSSEFFSADGTTASVTFNDTDVIIFEDDGTTEMARFQRDASSIQFVGNTSELSSTGFAAKPSGTYFAFTAGSVASNKGLSFSGDIRGSLSAMFAFNNTAGANSYNSATSTQEFMQLSSLITQSGTASMNFFDIIIDDNSSASGEFNMMRVDYQNGGSTRSGDINFINFQDDGASLFKVTSTGDAIAVDTAGFGWGTPDNNTFQGIVRNGSNAVQIIPRNSHGNGIDIVSSGSQEFSIDTVASSHTIRMSSGGENVEVLGNTSTVNVTILSDIAQQWNNTDVTIFEDDGSTVMMQLERDTSNIQLGGSSGIVRLGLSGDRITGVQFNTSDNADSNIFNYEGIATNTSQRVINFSSQTTGIVADGLGTGLQFSAENSAGVNANLGFIDFRYNDSTTATEDSRIELKIVAAGSEDTAAILNEDDEQGITLGSDLNQIIVTRKVTLSQSEIQSINTTPIELIPAPGSGKYIQIMSASAKLNHNATTYSGASGILNMIYGAGGTTFNTGSLITSAFTVRQHFREGGTDDISANTAVNLTAANDFTGAGGTIDVYVQYVIITE